MPLPRHALYGGILCASLAGCYLSEDYSGGLPPESGDPGGASTTEGGAAGQSTKGGAGGVSGFPSGAGKGGASSAGKGGASAGKGGTPPGAGQGGTVSAGTAGQNTAGSTAQGGSGAAGQTGAGGSPPMQPPCAQLAAAHCQRLTSQCSLSYQSTGAQGLQQCQERTTAYCEAVRTLPGVPPDILLCAQRILSGQAARGCESPGDPFYACRLPGALPDGATCASSAQCQGGLCLSLFGPCGTCQTWLDEGQPCQPEALSLCGPGLSCQSSKCTPRQPAGGSCTYVTDCQSGLSCQGMTCQPTLPLGAACTTFGECNEGQGQFCVNASCQPPLVAAPGDLCGPFPQYTVCPGDQFCLISMAGFDGTCVPPAPDGGACDPNSKPCLPPAICDAGVCRLVPSCAT